MNFLPVILSLFLLVNVLYTLVTFLVFDGIPDGSTVIMERSACHMMWRHTVYFIVEGIVARVNTSLQNLVVGLVITLWNRKQSSQSFLLPKGSITFQKQWHTWNPRVGMLWGIFHIQIMTLCIQLFQKHHGSSKIPHGDSSITFQNHNHICENSFSSLSF